MAADAEAAEARAPHDAPDWPPCLDPHLHPAQSCDEDERTRPAETPFVAGPAGTGNADRAVVARLVNARSRSPSPDTTLAALADATAKTPSDYQERMQLMTPSACVPHTRGRGEATLPPELLYIVLDHTVPCESRLAFSLASVCRRWRRVALSHRALWSTISSELLGVDLSRLETQLTRSKDASLDIEISWDSTARDLAELVSLLALLGAQACRWRRLTLRLSPLSAEVTLAAGFLSRPTPLLEEMAFITSFGPSVPSTPPARLLLPDAPRLRVLKVSGAGTTCSVSSAFPALRDLRVRWDARADEGLYGSLSRAPGLVVVEVDVPVRACPPSTIALRNLKRLDVGWSSGRLLVGFPSRALELPMLEELHLHCELREAIVPFLDAVSGTVRILGLGSVLTPDELDVVQALRRVEQLRFYPRKQRPDYLDPDLWTKGSVTAPALVRLASDVRPVWPELEAIRCLDYDPSLERPFLAFVRARTGGSVKTSRGLRTLDFWEEGYGGKVPPRVLKEVALLLNPHASSAWPF
ncbi:hypothetical protein AURDEDRAFT_177278 [Auricularia subglabra TFB-10046 SS5]|uniref:F-box domain-containing protein n=1 Tax=Auricularia subglabra (strain TFB-10046 / SS5) TaxID=717982 RepID=J0WP49_AURST|nr:hypothetical protein AURDEDRAFT_177278 [Auricularia subglabra TFB-10046 SS5]